LLVYIAAVLTFLVASKQDGGQPTPSDAPSSHSGMLQWLETY
jgi:hypothetical protein